ncbi:MAG: cadmium-translocating P-type ATPase [Bacteroidetes bacterium]|nr:cadmium-translocating P-type ATPase [Bacteroidota bacterium]
MHHHGEHIDLKIEGMDCANCATGITKRLTKKGYHDVQVNFATGEASLEMAENASMEDVIGEIEDLGYKVLRGEEKKKITIGIREKFWFCLLFTIPLFFGHFFLPHDHFLLRPATQLLLCIPVFLVGAIHFGKSSFGSLKSGVPNMDVLILMGSTAAFIYSIAGYYLHSGMEGAEKYMFFETTATIITLVLLGNLLEHISVKKTTSAISELSALQPENAHLITTTGNEEKINDIASRELKVHDLVLVNTGESFPADGIVIAGNGTVNEAMITGESVPAEKNTSSVVTGGTILLAGPLRVKITSTGKNTSLSKIIQLVKQAQQEKPPVQKLADRISAIFVPVVLAIAIATFLFSHFLFSMEWSVAMMHAIAVLVISCPCAMGLATPTAVMVGIGRAARNGILIRGGRTLEEIAAVKTIVFDKTGTLTTGKFSNFEINVNGNEREESLQNILFTLEQNSSHPLAKSICGILEKKNAVIVNGFTSIQEKKGIGISGTDASGNKWEIGSWRILPENNGNDADIYILKNNFIAASITLNDEIRPGMKEMIAFLKMKKIQTVLLSGDRKNKCDHVAAQTGIEKVFAEQLPENKSAVIAQLVKEGKTAMVGDGINDAPALALANVGISPGDASRIAMQSSQVVLLGSNEMKKLREAFLIGKASVRTIRQNLFWAFFYNVVAIPIAAAGLLNPMIAALAMAFSDVIVIGNSILLRTKKLS